MNTILRIYQPMIRRFVSGYKLKNTEDRMVAANLIIPPPATTKPGLEKQVTINHFKK